MENFMDLVHWVTREELSMLDNLNKAKDKVEEVCIAMEKQNLQLGKMITLFLLCDWTKL